MRAERYQDIAVQDVISMKAGDFDMDGADDVVLLKSDNSIDVFWATKSVETSVEFETTRLILPSERATCIYADDYNNDGETDFIVGADNATLYIIPGHTGRSWKKAIEVDAFNASHITVSKALLAVRWLVLVIRLVRIFISYGVAAKGLKHPARLYLKPGIKKRQLSVIMTVMGILMWP